MPVTAVQRSVGEAAGTATDAHAAAFQNAASQAPGAGGGNPAANGGSDSQAQTRSGGVPPGGGSASPGAADVAKRVNPPATLPDTPTLPNPPAAPSGPDPHGGNLAADFESKVQSGDVDAVMRLIHDKPKGFDINATLPGTGGQNALQLVMSQGTQGQTSSDLAEALLQGGIDDTHLDGAGQSAYALAKGKASDSSSAGKDYQALATKVGRDLNTKLDQAVAKGDADAVGRLVTAGADVNAKDDQGRTALFYAYSGVLGQPMVLPGTSTGLGQPGAPNQAGQALIAHGADLTATDNDGKSINDYITATLNTPTSGREPDASWHSDLRKAANDLHDAATQQLRKAVLDDGKDGAAPGHAPVLDQALTEAKAVALVKQAGADGSQGLNGPDSPNRTPSPRDNDMSIAQYAAATGQADLTKAIVSQAGFIGAPALINQQWAGGNTLMHLAAASKQTTLYDWLKQQGGNDTITNGEGKTPAALEQDASKRGLPLLAAASLGGLLNPVAVGAMVAAGVGYAAYKIFQNAHGQADKTTDQNNSDLADALVAGDQQRGLTDVLGGADPKGQFGDGLGYLLYAAGTGQDQVARALVEAVPQGERAGLINAKGVGGLTALNAAAYDSAPGADGAPAQTIYNYLVTQGGDAGIKDAAGLAPKEAKQQAEASQLVARGDPNDAGMALYRPGQHRLRNWLRQQVDRVRRPGTSTGPTGTGPAAPQGSPPETGGGPSAPQGSPPETGGGQPVNPPTTPELPTTPGQPAPSPVPADPQAITGAGWLAGPQNLQANLDRVNQRVRELTGQINDELGTQLSPQQFFPTADIAAGRQPFGVQLGSLTIRALPSTDVGTTESMPVQQQSQYVLQRLADIVNTAQGAGGRSIWHDIVTGQQPVTIVPFKNVYMGRAYNGARVVGGFVGGGGAGSSSTIEFAPDFAFRSQNYRNGSPAPWTLPQNFPPDVALIHEAKHIVQRSDMRATGAFNGQTATIDGVPATWAQIWGPNQGVWRINANGVPVNWVEARATGLGPYADVTRFPDTENAERARRGLPLRTFYSDPRELSQVPTQANPMGVWGAPNAPWNQPGWVPPPLNPSNPDNLSQPPGAAPP